MTSQAGNLGRSATEQGNRLPIGPTGKILNREIRSPADVTAKVQR